MVRAMLGLIALILGGGSLAMSVLFAMSMPGGQYATYLWVAVAVGACLAKLTAPAAYRDKPWKSSLGLRALFVIALIIDSSFTGGFTATTRDAFTGALVEKDRERQAQVDKVADAKRALDAAPPARAIEIIEADLASARRLTRGCRSGTKEAQNETCTAIAGYEREKANVEVKERLQHEYESASDRLSAMPEVIVYPEAHRIAKTLRTMGLDAATDERVSLFLSLLMVLLFEIGSVATARAALTKGASKPLMAPSSLPSAAPARRTSRVSAAPARPNVDHSPVVLAALSDAATGKAVPGIQKDPSGALHLSQRALHRHLNVPARALAAALNSLEATGRAHVAKGPGGTAVKLIGKLAAVP